MHELERTFLPRALPDLLNAPSRALLDIYLPASSEHPTLRVRRHGETYEITKKQPVREGDASHQLETTIPLTAAEFDELARVPGKRVEKVRYEHVADGVRYEIDVFGGDLSGLVLVDVEFATVEAKDAFMPPAWLCADVTQERAVAGGMLCGKRYADLEARLRTFGYVPLTGLAVGDPGNAA